jgi:hypothetical protein
MTEERREATNAGTFYPADRGELDRMITGFLSSAVAPGNRRPRAVVVPHAGYAYSGPTAAHAYKAIQGGAGGIRRVVLIAPSHYAGFEGVVVNARTYQTPLGSCPSDTEAIGKLKGLAFPFTSNATAEVREHADEVQVPFIQKALPGAMLVPVLVGVISETDMDAAARAVSSVVDDGTVIVVSSDFTHYGPRFGYVPSFAADTRSGIYELDRKAIDLIVGRDVAGFTAYLERTRATICGRDPIRLLMKVLALKGWKAGGELLHYVTSGDLTGDFGNSVSYAAIALY